MNHSFLHAGLKQNRSLLGHNGMAEIGALPLAASVALKEVELRSRLHSHRNDSLLQTFSDTDHGTDESCPLGIRRDLLHERLTDFQSVHRKTPQIGKAGVARAKIVDGHPYPHRLQR